jgi:hypothetical protein
MSNEKYTIYGEEWKKEMSKLPKAVLIDIAAKIGQDKERLEELADLRTQCRHYLMGVPSDEITVEDALESLGYGRDGLVS